MLNKKAKKPVFDLKAQAERAAALAASATYRGFYGLGYGFASAACFLGDLFCEENPVRKGFQDGAAAAVTARKAPVPRRPARTKTRGPAAAPAQV